MKYTSYLHSLPLVDEQCLVSVVEPGHVLEPVQEPGCGRVVKEEPSEEHQRDDQGRHDGEGEAAGGGPDAGGEVSKGRKGAPAHQHPHQEAHEEALGRGIQPDHVVGERNEQNGIDGVERQLGHVLGHEVDVRSVHAVLVLALQEQRPLAAERVDDHRDVLERHVGEDEEENAVDVEHSHLIE